MWKNKVVTVGLFISAIILHSPGYFVTTISIPSCISIQEAINKSLFFMPCGLFIQNSKIFLFLPQENYKRLLDDLRILEVAVLSSSHYCDQVIRTYLCNYLYPTCEENGSVPIGVCQEECIKFLLTENSCTSDVDFLVSLRSTLTVQRQCNNTLKLVEDSGVSVNVSSNCINITEIVSSKITTTSVLQESTKNDLQTSDPSSASLVVAVVPTAVSIAVLTTIAVIISVSIFWCYRKRRSKLIKTKSYSSAPPSNSYQFNDLINKSDSKEEVPLFTLSIEDVMKNPRLKHALVSFDSLTIQKEIGHGAFGSVFQGKYTPNPEESSKAPLDVAVKTIKNSSASFVELKNFLEESVVMCGFDHPHVLGLIGICLDPSNSPYLLLPFMENGDLRTYLKNKRDKGGVSHIDEYPQGLDYDVLFRMCLDIAQGMEYLACKRLVHRDLAARNCMVDVNLGVKVADFGLTRDIYETDYYRQTHQGRVPIKWMALESLHDRISNEKTDVWSYGVTCWEIFSLGRTPYPSVPNADMMDYLEKGRRLKKPPLTSKALYALLKTCWTPDPQNRPDFSQLCLSLQGNLPDDMRIQNDINRNMETQSKVYIKSENEEQSEYLEIICPAEEIVREDTKDKDAPSSNNISK